MRPNVPILSVLRPWTVRNFRKKLVPEGKCLVFTGSRNKRGYGFVEVTGLGGEARYPILAHRLAWALEHRCDPPADRIICHKCHNPSCCLPKHLYAGTAQDNVDDMIRAGRQPKGLRAGLFGMRGVKHPRAKYSQEIRDRAIELRRNAEPFAKISAEVGVPHRTIELWWKQMLSGFHGATT